MEMTIDKAISWLLSIAEHEGEEIQVYDEDVEAIKMGIETMRKYQKIQEIVKNTQQLCSYGSAFIDIREVIEDGNDNNSKL